MDKEIKNKIKKVSDSYIKYLQSCDRVAKEAQKYIKWDKNIGCENFPGDGVCLTTSDTKVCPATSFFSVIEEKGRIDRNEFERICI